MSEYTFASIGQYGMTVTPLTGASGALTNLYVLGQQNGSSSKRTLTVNHTNQLVYSGVDHSTRRGLNLAIFDQSMKLTFMATYDTYGDKTNACKSLSDKLKTLTSSQIGVLSSYDAMYSTDELDATFNSFRTVMWPGATYLGTTPRVGYAAIVCGKKQAIVAEKLVGYQVGIRDAIIELAFNSPLLLGYEGFGKSIINDDTINEGTDGSSHVVDWIDNKPLTDFNLKVGDEFVFKSLGEIDSVAKTAGKNLEYLIQFTNSSATVIKEIKHRVTSVEGWEDVVIRDSIPSGTARISVGAKCIIDAGGSNQGKIYVKNTSMQLSDNTALQSAGISIGLYGTSVNEYEDSLGGFGQYDPDGYYEAYQAESNLIKTKAARAIVDQPVNWFNMILDKDTERTIIRSTGTETSTISKVPFDPTKWYYLCVWVNRKVKNAGVIGLGLSQFDSANKALTIKATDGSGSGTKLYSQMPPFDTLETRQWYLLQGFIIPNTVPQDEVNAFIEENKEFYGWDDIYGTGIGLSDEGNGIYGWVSNPSAKTLDIYYEDSGNTSESETSWALPILRELKTGSIDIDDGLLTSISITG